MRNGQKGNRAIKKHPDDKKYWMKEATLSQGQQKDPRAACGFVVKAEEPWNHNNGGESLRKQRQSGEHVPYSGDHN